MGCAGHFDHSAQLAIAHDAHVLAGGEDVAHQFFSACANHLGAASVGDVVEAVATADNGQLVVLRHARGLAPICIVDFSPR